MAKADDRKRKNYHDMAVALLRLETDLHGRWRTVDGSLRRGTRLPKAAGGGAKVKMTLWVERSVLAIFRAMGAANTTRLALP